ncbi:MAG: dihydrofolate reductase [Phycisphaeraceae bacterium]
MTITIIAAMSENRVIGAGGALPWRLSADLKHFKQLTTGHPILMGRKTFDSIGKPLPNRRNIVLTRDASWSHPGVEIAHSFDGAVAMIEPNEELFVIGGEQIYRLALPEADRMHLTLVHARVQGDAMFPTFPEHQWQLIDQHHHPADERNEHPMTFLHYQRRR